MVIVLSVNVHLTTPQLNISKHVCEPLGHDSQQMAHFNEAYDLI